MKRIVPITMLMLLLMAMFSLALNIKSTKARKQSFNRLLF
jgi:hypothetical protein